MAAPVLTDDANAAFFDALVRHQVYLARYSGAVRNRILKLIDETEDEIVDRIRRRLENAPGGLGKPRELRRLETLLEGIRKVRFEGWDKASKAWVAEGTALAVSEPALISGILQTVAPVVLDTVMPPARLLRSIATSRPFEGRTLREWAKSAAQEDVRRISNVVRTGMVSGDSISKMVSKIVGTQALKRSDGVTQITRNGIEAITRTAVNHISNAARSEFFNDNRDIFSKELYVATLDARTTPICRSLDGKLFDVGTGPVPPQHFSCRSVRVAVLDGGAFGDRPARNFTERRLLQEFAEKNGLGKITTRDALPRGTRGDFDAFSRRRKRQLTGQVPAKTTYAEWLSRQSAEIQDDILGKTRGKLFRNGGLSLDRFVNRAGDEIPLRDLAKRHEDAFRAAGFDPSGF